MDKTNKNKFQYQPVIVSKEKETIWLIFSYYRCTLEVKLNIEWQIGFLVKKINLDMMEEMVTLTVLYWIKNFKSCNKHLCVFAKHLGFITTKILVVDFKL